MPSESSVWMIRHPPDAVFFDVFEEMAKAMGLGYGAQFCELAHDACGWEINTAALVVDLDVLRENLR